MPPAPTAAPSQTNPDAFKALIVGKYPNGVSSDGTKYSEMSAQDLTQRIVSKYPSGITNDGRKYSDFLSASTPTNNPPPDQPSGLFGSLGNIAGAAAKGAANFLAGPAETIGTRLGQGAAYLTGKFAGNTGLLGGKAEEQKINARLAQPQQTLTGGSVEPFKGGAAGAKQVAGEGLDAALLYAPYGKVLSAGKGLLEGAGIASKFAKPISRAITGTAAGYTFDQASQLNQGKTPDFKPGLGTVIGAGTGLLSAAGALNTSKIAEDVSPKLTPTRTAEAVASGGTTKTPILGTIKPTITKQVQKVADTVQKYVPNFDSYKTFSDKVNATRTVVNGMADDLKKQVVASGQDKFYSFRELNSKLARVDKPIAIKSDATLSRQFDLARQAAVKIAQEKGGKISSLFDARKQFDTLVQKEFPNLYDKENAPMRNAITAIRSTMNDFIAQNLPNVAFKQSLSNQNHLLTAIENLSEKAVGEVGTSRVGRAAAFVKNHPVGSAIGGAAAGAGAIIGGNQVLKNTTGIGF